jgi:Na+-driven multidrug efflux pump
VSNGLVGLRVRDLPLIAGMALVSQNLGARQPTSAAQGGWTAFALGCGTMTAMGVVFFALARPMCELYSPDSDAVASLAVTALRMIAFVMPFLAASIIFTSAAVAVGSSPCICDHRKTLNGPVPNSS